MKIQIDTTKKTIKVEEVVNFCEMNKELKKLLGDELKNYSVLPYEYKLNSYPVYVDRWKPNVPFWSVEPYLNPGPTLNPYQVTCKLTTT